jgi:hypothetical protein
MALVTVSELTEAYLKVHLVQLLLYTWKMRLRMAADMPSVKAP